MHKLFVIRYSLFVIRYSLFLILITIILLPTSTIKAQIVIKEKVEINPTGETLHSDYPRSSYDPCENYPGEQHYQVVYSCSMFPVEPYQQLFPFQGGGDRIAFLPNDRYEIAITSGTTYAYLVRTAYQDSLGNFYPAEYIGHYLSNKYGYELSGTGQYEPNMGSGTFVRGNSTLYYIHFNNYDETEANVTVRITDLDSNITTYWHTIVVNPAIEITNIGNQEDTLLHYYSKDVSFRIRNKKYNCEHPGYGGCPPTDVNFGIEIVQGLQYGSIKNSQTGEINTSFSDLSWEDIRSTVFTYYANGLQPDSTEMVTIRHYSNDAEIQPQYFSFIVKNNRIPPPSEGGAIYIQADKKEVMPSDTVEIHLKWITEIGDTTEFLPMQRFKVELAEGEEYGRLIDLGSGTEGDILDDAGSELLLVAEDQIEEAIARITIVAQADLLIWTRPVSISGVMTNREDEAREIKKEKEPIAPEFIIVGDHITGVEEIIVNKYPFVVEIIPEEIAAGDTARIVPKKRNRDGSLEEFPIEQQFELGMLEGCLLGKIIAEGTDSNYHYGVTQPFYFIADSSTDSGTVKIRVGLIEPVVGNKIAGSNKITEANNTESYCFINTYQSNIYKDASVKKKEEIGILLGETKYFQAKRNTVTGEMKIEEILPDANGVPQRKTGIENGWEWLTSDVWGENPVSVVEGDKLGVYWEKEKPVWVGITNKGNLQKGLIRLVGKYWEEGKTYKVKLTAKMGSQENSINLAIKKPNKIESNYNISKYKKNVFNEEFNLDSLIFIFAGKYGIPPQIIKAQMMRESSFRPAYRYEPFPDATGIQSGYMYKNNRYKIISVSNEGSPEIPSSHINVLPHEYWGYQGTIWEFFYNHSSTLNKDISFGSSLDIYPRKNSSGEYVWFEKPANIWKVIYDKKYKEKVEEELSEEIAKDSALSAANFWLRYTYCGGIMNTGIAQTRMSSSYGFLQITYYRALEKFGYVENDENYPEKLNEINAGTDFSLKTLVDYMNKELGTERVFDDTNWKDGLEITFRYGLSRYNGKRIIPMDLQP